MRRFAWGIAALLAISPAMAEEWTAMTGPEIEAALDERTLIYEGNIKQIFYKSGKTLYDNGRPSWGNWAVRGDQYCSEWPPAGGWACYDMDRHSSDGKLRFVSETGHVTEGNYSE